ncbi:retrovirus-related pol polyprotein from transposon TNT 1-94 [Tanacetum coccineum]
MLTKPQVFNDDTHKQALGYQNLFYLKKTQRIKPTLYDGSVISNQHVASHVTDDEETLILKEVSRSKMLAKQNDPMSKEKKVNTTLINYVELNRLSEDFGKRFVPQQELSTEQAFWLQTSHPNLLRHLSKLRLLRNFLRDLLNEITEVHTVFNQIEATVQQCFVDKQCFEIHKKELFLENDRLLHQIMSQDVMICVMNPTAVNDVNLEMQRSEFCVKRLDLDAELLNKQNAYNDLSKSYSQFEKHCISLELTMQLNQEIFQKDSLRMFKLDLDPLAPRLLKNRDAHIDYLKYAQDQADILRGIVEQAKAKQPLDNALNFASRDTNLYTISLDDMLNTSLICLLSKALKTKSWLWHRRLSYLNFGTLNKLAKDGLARGIPKFKYNKDHLCSACALGKSKKSSHQPKAEDTNQEKLYLLHKDLRGLMRIESINGKRLKQSIQLVIPKNHSLIRLRYNKTSYELMHDKNSDLSFLHVFGSLCYPTNDSEDLGKLNAKADIGIFIGYAPVKKDFRIYNRRT